MIRIVMLYYFSVHLSVIFVNAQEPKIKFGDISPKDFAVTRYAVDTAASAVILADIGSSYFEGNQKSGISLVFDNYRRAHVLNKNGFGIGTVEIFLNTKKEVEDKLTNLKAVTYNFENGKVIETKLNLKTAIFEDRITKNYIIRKFTFPNLKAGSIIEYEYSIKTENFFSLQPWDFQGEYPRLWSEYTARIPSFLKYVTLVQGYNSYLINTHNQKQETFHISEARSINSDDMLSIKAIVDEYKWAMQDVLPLVKEDFTTTLRNHISRVEFQLHSFLKPYVEKNVMNNWKVVTEELLEREDFGLPLLNDNSWLDETVSVLIKNESDRLLKAERIYEWVRDNMTCTNYNGFFIKESLKEVFKNRSGHVAEINLLLTAMLRKAGIIAYPVLLSTRSNGYAHAEYPIMDRYNYVICRFINDDKPVHLDASIPDMGFGFISAECYNGFARVINEDATVVNFSADSIKDTKLTTVLLFNEKSGSMIGSYSQVAGIFTSFDIRRSIKENSAEKFMKGLAADIFPDMVVTKTKIDSISIYEKPVACKVEFNWKPALTDVVYVNPMFGKNYTDNPFKSTKRSYPVEMPYLKDEIYTLQMDIPEGYLLDELPEQAVVKLNDDGDMQYEYRISNKGSVINFKSRLLIRRTFFMPEEYENLRNFFSFIIAKQNEQIVFKKKI